MSVRRVMAVAGLLAAVGFAAREPAAVRAAPPKATNVVPSTFRAQLVYDKRFPLKVVRQKEEDIKDDDRDPRDRTGKMHCLVCEYGLSPVVAIFVRETPKVGDGLSKLLTKLDAPPKAANEPREGLLTKYKSEKLTAFAMFLKLEGGTKMVPVKDPAPGEPDMVTVDLEYPHDEKRAEKVEEVKAYFRTVNTDKIPFGLAAEKSTAVTAFGIMETTPITVVIYNRLRVVKRWELKSDELTDEKIAEILSATTEMVTGKKP